MKDAPALINKLLAMKSASHPETATDPENKGPVSLTPGGTDISTETRDPSGPQSPSTENATPPPSTESAAAQVEEGDVPVPAASKEAFIASVQIAKSKLAAIGSKPTNDAPKQEAPAPAVETPKQEAPAPAVETPKQAAAEEHPLGYWHTKIASHLLSTARGRTLLHDAIAEVQGVEATRDLLKAAAADQEAFEKAFLQNQLERMNLEKAAAEEQENMRIIEDTFAELTKSATAEDLEKINEGAAIIKRAAERYANSPEETLAFQTGMKVAAAMLEAGGDPAAGGDPMAGMPPVPEGEPSIQEIVMALEQLVASGEITPEQAEAALAELAGGMGGGAPEGGGEPPAKEASAPSTREANVLAIVDSACAE